LKTSQIQKYFRDIGIDITVDGIAGHHTNTIIKSFQYAFDLKVDGIVGLRTQNKMSNIRNGDILSTAHRNGDILSTAHFKQWEFNCRCCNGNIGIPVNLLIYLEAVKLHNAGKIVHVVSGYRCPSHNKNCGGATKSQHLKGKAADIIVRGVLPSETYNYCSWLFKDNGVGKYNTFTHADVRGYRSRW